MHARWRALGLMFAVQLVGSAVFFAPTVLTPFIKSEFGLSAAEVGLLITVLYAGYFCFLIPGGAVTDRLGERSTLAIGLGVLGGVGLVLSASPVYWSVFAGLFVAGIGYATVPPGTNKGVFDWFPAEQRATGLSFKQTGVMIGSAGGAALLPAIAVRSDWRVAFGTVGASALCSLAFVFVYSAPASTDGDDSPGASATLAEVWALVRRREVAALLLAGLFFGANQFTLMGYVVLYLTEGLALLPAVAGGLYAAMQLSGAASRIVSGLLADVPWFARRKYLLLVAGGGLAGVLYVPVISLAPGSTLSAVALASAALGALALGYNGIYLTVANELAGPDRTGLSTGIAITAIMIGAVATPPVFGVLVDATGGYAIPLTMLAALSVLAGAAALFVGPYRPPE